MFSYRFPISKLSVEMLDLILIQYNHSGIQPQINNLCSFDLFICG